MQVKPKPYKGGESPGHDGKSVGHGWRLGCGDDSRRGQASHYGWWLGFSMVFLARHLSEQKRTESQFLDQDLRQVMVRPQAAHSLLGRNCLLPLKPFFTVWMHQTK